MIGGADSITFARPGVRWRALNEPRSIPVLVVSDSRLPDNPAVGGGDLGLIVGYAPAHVARRVKGDHVVLSWIAYGFVADIIPRDGSDSYRANERAILGLHNRGDGRYLTGHR